MDETSPRVLIVDDERDICDLVSHLLKEDGIATSVACDGISALRELRRASPDLLILDLRLPDMDGMEVMRRALALDDELPIVILTAHGGVRDAAQAIREHAFDFLPKPYNHGELLAVVRSGLQRRRMLLDSRRSCGGRNQSEELFSIMGQSDAVARLVADVSRVAGCNFNVVIVGETGTGKEVVARAIHRGGVRAKKPFVPIDCGAIPETLIESELFGHEKGAFTGAVGATPGRFEEADEGTLFLDEILNMPLSAQAKVLRALQEKCVCRIGGSRQIRVNVRVLAACGSNLEQATEAGRFRADLLYRLSEFTLRVPALRERPEDIAYLANRFLRMTNGELGKKVCGFSAEAERRLLTFPWPGNVRQLRSTIRRAVLLADERIGVEHLDIPLLPGIPSDARPEGGAPGPLDLPLREIVARSTMCVERTVLVRTLLRTHGNKAKAARLLQIDYKTIQSKLKQYGIIKSRRKYEAEERQ